MCSSKVFTPLIVPMVKKWHPSSSVRDSAGRLEESLTKTSRKTFKPGEQAKRDYEKNEGSRLEDERNQRVMKKKQTQEARLASLEGTEDKNKGMVF